MDRPPSIHDPVTPEQAYHLPAFFWNVRPATTPAEQRAQKRADKQREKDKIRYERRRDRLNAEREQWAASKVSAIVDPHQRLVHEAPVRRGRMA